jgi:hypothetical protein
MMNSPTKPFDISASRIKLYTTCPRKWAFKYLENLPEPSTQATNFGSTIHKEVEEYYLNAAKPSTLHATALLRHLPQPSPKIKAEASFSFLYPIDAVTVNFRGAVDLIDTETNTVFDHKTTSNLKYALEPHQLELDPQPIIYGMYYRLIHQKQTQSILDDVNIQFTYVLSKDKAPKGIPQTKVTKLKQSLTILDNGIDSMRKPIIEMHEHTVACSKANSVAANTDACWNYGKCPFADHCDAFGKTKEPQMSNDLLARLAALSAAPVAPTPAMTKLEETTEMFNNSTAPLSILDTLEIALDKPVDIMPPDHQGDVTPEDPSPETHAVVGEKPAKKATKKAKPEASIPEESPHKYTIEYTLDQGIHSNNLQERLLACILDVLLHQNKKG